MDKFKINKYSLAFDFDGVLCDSQEECFEVACKLFIKEESASDIQKFYNSNKKNIFSYRPYIINGEDYYFIIKALYSGVKLKNQFEFDDYKISNQHIIKKIRKKFYETRKLLIQKDLKYWISKNPLYEHIPNALNELMKKYDIYIITTKDKISVQKILFHYKIYVDPDNIFSKELNLSKKECLKKIILNKKLDYIAFIEDQIENLLSINIPEVGLFLADWGYNNNFQIHMAKKNNVTIIDLENFPENVTSTYP